MAEEPATVEEPAKEQEHQESFWASFNQADMKLFVLTFAGTVAANIVTVMVVAVAVILVRAKRTPTWSALLYSAAAATFLGYVITTVARFLPSSNRTKRLIRISSLPFGLLVCFGVLLLVLILLGDAAGIK
jgi:hypothetical protein